MKPHLLALLQDNCLDLLRCAFLRKLSGRVRNITAFCQLLLRLIISAVLADAGVSVKPKYRSTSSHYAHPNLFCQVVPCYCALPPDVKWMAGLYISSLGHIYFKFNSTCFEIIPTLMHVTPEYVYFVGKIYSVWDHSGRVVAEAGLISVDSAAARLLYFFHVCLALRKTLLSDCIGSIPMSMNVILLARLCM